MKRLVTEVVASRVRNTLRVSAAFARAMRAAASALLVAPRSKVILSLLLIVGAIPGWAQSAAMQAAQKSLYLAASDMLV